MLLIVDTAIFSVSTCLLNIFRRSLPCQRFKFGDSESRKDVGALFLFFPIVTSRDREKEKLVRK